MAATGSTAVSRARARPWIAELEDGGGIRTLSYWSAGAYLAQTRFALEGTPCVQVIAGRVRTCVSDAQAHFPAATLLAELGVHSYAGFPLSRAGGEVFGLIAVLDDKPVEDPELTESPLAMIAARVAAEIDRTRTAEALERRERELRMLLDFPPAQVARHDAELRDRYVSQRYRSFFGIDPERDLLGVSCAEIVGEAAITPRRAHLGRILARRGRRLPPHPRTAPTKDHP